MKLKYFPILLISTVILLQIISVPVASKEISVPNRMSVDITYTPVEIRQGESFTITVVVTNETYKENYDEGDMILTNPRAAIDFYHKGQYLVPSQAQWDLTLGSMANCPTKTFTKSFNTAGNIPAGYFHVSVLSWSDKNDQSTLDHETQGQPLIILSTDQQPPQTPVPSTTVEEVKEEERNVHCNLPEKLIQENSTTTRIDQMTKEELQNIENFTLEVVGKNKVVFQRSLNLSSDETIAKLNNLSNYIDLSITGKITIDTSYLDILNIPAEITMFGLPFEGTPLIYKNDKLVTKDEVNNIVYIYSQKESGSLTFDVSSFSTYEARDSEVALELSQSPTETTGVYYFSLTKLLLTIALITILGIAVALVVKIIERRKAKRDK